VLIFYNIDIFKVPRNAKKYKIINNFFNFIYFLIIFEFLEYLNSKLFIILKSF
jgi:hypothetical protein